MWWICHRNLIDQGIPWRVNLGTIITEPPMFHIYFVSAQYNLYKDQFAEQDIKHCSIGSFWKLKQIHFALDTGTLVNFVFRNSLFGSPVAHNFGCKLNLSLYLTGRNLDRLGLVGNNIRRSIISWPEFFSTYPDQKNIQHILTKKIFNISWSKNICTAGKFTQPLTTVWPVAASSSDVSSTIVVNHEILVMIRKTLIKLQLTLPLWPVWPVQRGIPV